MEQVFLIESNHKGTPLTFTPAVNIYLTLDHKCGHLFDTQGQETKWEIIDKSKVMCNYTEDVNVPVYIIVLQWLVWGETVQIKDVKHGWQTLLPSNSSLQLPKWPNEQVSDSNATSGKDGEVVL